MSCRLLFALTTACVFLLCTSLSSLACSPIRNDSNTDEDWGRLQQFQNADLVFIGTVIKSGIATTQDDSSYEWQYSTFVINDILKGEHTESISFKENITCCLCGITVDKNTTYLIYTKNEHGEQRLKLAIESVSEIKKHQLLIEKITSGIINIDRAKKTDFQKPLYPPTYPRLTEIEKAIYDDTDYPLF